MAAPGDNAVLHHIAAPHARGLIVRSHSGVLSCSPRGQAYNGPMRIRAVILAVVCLAPGGCEYEEPRSTLADNEYAQLLATPAPDPPARSWATAAPANVELVAQVVRVDPAEQAVLEVLWRYVDTAVTTPERPAAFAEAGLRAGLCKEGFRGQLQVLVTRLKSGRISEHAIGVVSGSSAAVTLAKGIPLPGFYYAGHWYSRIDFDFVNTAKTLRVGARTFPNETIELELTPVLSGFLSGGDLRLYELTCRTVVRPGQSIILGDSPTAGQTVATGFLSSTEADRHDKLLVILTARVQ